MERPKYRINPWRDRRGVECCDIEAYFDSDPYLRRAGIVAKIIHMVNRREAVEDACAKKVVDFLRNMVREQCGMNAEPYVVEEKENNSLHSGGLAGAPV